VVGEILETVAPDAEVLTACRRMKDLGYRWRWTILRSAGNAPALDVADFVKSRAADEHG